MTSIAFDQLTEGARTQLSRPAVVLVTVMALLLLSAPALRALAIDIVCHMYVAIVHRPFRSATTNFFFSTHDAPLPPTNSLWSHIQASTMLKWQARSNRLRHEKDIPWDDVDAVRNGDMIEAWDRIAEWDTQCFHPHKLEQLRNIGDPLADNALDQMESTATRQSEQASTDTLRKIYDRASVHSELQDDGAACMTFWTSIDRRPPPGAGALSLEWYEACYGANAVGNLKRWPRFASTKQQEPDSSLPIWTPRDPAAIDAQNELAELKAEAEVIRRGQEVFYRYAGPILTVLLHFSLAGGFASPRITEVLKQTAYLVPNASIIRAKNQKSTDTPSLPTVEDLRQAFKVDKARADRTWSRLVETTQFVLDVVEKADSLLPPSIAARSTSHLGKAEDKSRLVPPEQGGEGWQSAVRVRLLHTTVRRRVLKLVEKRRSRPSSRDGSSYNVDKNGVPINQEDMLGTLCAFSSAPLVMLQRIGVRPTRQEREDYIALWRHVGFYMGIEPALLRRAFVDAHAADRTMFCTILHLFNQVEVLSGDSAEQKNASQPRMQGPTIPVLIACADRPPFHTPLSAHVAIARRLLGKSMADSLALPASSARREVLTDIAFFVMQVPILFGRYYPRTSWEKRRLHLVRPLLRRVIVFSFGNKRTKFELPASPSPSSSSSAAAAAGEATGSVGSETREKVNVETQSHAHLDVPEDKEHIAQLAREWRWLMREMLAVLVLTALIFVSGIAFAVTHLVT